MLHLVFVAALATDVPISLDSPTSGSLVTDGVDRYTFTAPADQRVYIDALTTQNYSGHRWRLLDRHERVVAEEPARFNDIGDLTLVGGEYTIEVYGFAGDYSFEVTTSSTTEQAISVATPVTGALASAGDVAHFTVQEPAGQCLFFDLTSASNFFAMSWTLTDDAGRDVLPTGRDMSERSFVSNGSPYTLTIDGFGDGTGTFAFELTRCDTDELTPVLDTTVNGGLLTPGDVDHWTFELTEDTRVSTHFLFRSNRFGMYPTLLDAGGNTLQRSNSLEFGEPLWLDAGSYTLVVDGINDGVGAYDMVLHAVDDLDLDVSIDQAEVVALTLPGQNAALNFTASPGQWFAFDVLDADQGFGVALHLQDAAGRSIFRRNFLGWDAPVQLMGGDYTLVVDPAGERTLSTTVQLLEPVITPVAALLDLALPLGTTSVGEAVHVDFTISSPTEVRIELDAVTNTATHAIELRDSLGRVLATAPRLEDLDTLPLIGGDYTLVFFPISDQLSDWTLTLVDEGPVLFVPGGDAVDVETPTVDLIEFPGEHDLWSIQLAQDTRLYLELEQSEGPLRWTLRDAAGHPVFEGAPPESQGPFDLPAGGYELEFWSAVDGVHDYAFDLRMIEEETVTITPGVTVDVDIPEPGASVDCTFTVASQGEYYLDLLATDAAFGWTLLDDVGLPVYRSESVGHTSSDDVDGLQLVPGDYTLRIDPEGPETPTLQFVLYEVSNESSTLTVGTPVILEGSTPGIDYHYTFDVGTLAYFDILRTTGDVRWSLYSPAGREQFSAPANNTTTHDVGPLTLSPGEWTLVIDPNRDLIPSMEFVITDPPVLEQPAVPGEISGSFTVAGEQHRHTLTLQDEEAYFNVVSPVSNMRWSLTDPEGLPVFATTAWRDFYDDVDVLPFKAGDYTLTIDVLGGGLGDYTVEVVLPERTEEVAALGQRVEGELLEPGDQIEYTIEIGDGRAALFDLIDSTADLRWTLFDPAGQPVFGPTPSWHASNHDQGSFVLAGGTHILQIDGWQDAVGPFEFEILGDCDGDDQGGSATCDGACDPIDAPGSIDCDGACEAQDDPMSSDCDERCNGLDTLGGEDCDGICDPEDLVPSVDCDGICDFTDLEGSPDCRGSCGLGELVGSLDCNGVCEHRDRIDSVDCDGLCDPGDTEDSVDCNAVCDPMDLGGSVDCDASCDAEDALPSADCDGLCDAADATDSLDCVPGPCLASSAAGSPECDMRCGFVDEAGSPDCNAICDGTDMPVSPDCDGVCDVDDALGFHDCNRICELDEEGTPDCNAVCGTGEGEGNADCDGVCGLGDVPGPDCDLVCGEDDAAQSVDCDGFCTTQELGSPDCDDVCGFGEASDSPDCDDVCGALDAPGSFDCDGQCDVADHPDSPDCAVCPDSDGDGVCDVDDVCLGDDTTGDRDRDAVCDDVDACFGDDQYGDVNGDGFCEPFLEVGAVQPGAPLLLQVRNARPRSRVYFVVSTQGLGSACHPVIPVCLGVGAPMVVGTRMADSRGEASLLPVLPASVPSGMPVWFQAGWIENADSTGQASNIVPLVTP